MVTFIKFLQIILTNIRIHLVVVSLIAITLYIYLSKKECQLKEKTKELDNKIKIIDSLNSEIFVKEIDIGRYEYMMSLVEENNPTLYEKIMHETE
jgi:energy-converting hydrogenase Eha subunit H